MLSFLLLVYAYIYMFWVLWYYVITNTNKIPHSIWKIQKMIVIYGDSKTCNTGEQQENRWQTEIGSHFSEKQCRYSLTGNYRFCHCHGDSFMEMHRILCASFGGKYLNDNSRNSFLMARLWFICALSNNTTPLNCGIYCMLCYHSVHSNIALYRFISNIIFW